MSAPTSRKSETNSYKFVLSHAWRNAVVRDWREQSGAMILFAIVGFSSALLAIYQTRQLGRLAPSVEFVRGLVSLDLLQIFFVIAFAMSFLGFARLAFNMAADLDFEKPYAMLNVARSGLASLVFPLVAFLVGILLVDILLLAQSAKAGCDVTHMTSRLAVLTRLVCSLAFFYLLLVTVHAFSLLPGSRAGGMVACLVISAYFAVDFVGSVANSANANTSAVISNSVTEKARSSAATLTQCGWLEKWGM